MADNTTEVFQNAIGASPDSAPTSIQDAFDTALNPPAPAQSSTPVPSATPAQPDTASHVNVVAPDGQIGSLPQGQVQDAISAGYRVASDEEVDHHLKEQKYGTAGQQLITGAEGAADAATFGAASGIAQGLGVSTAEDRLGRAETNPISRGVGQIAGLGASALVAPEAGAAALMERAGAAGAEAVGLGAAETTMGKIGSAAVKSAIENMTFQGGDEVAKMINQDPNQSVSTALADIGLSGLIGGGIGGAIGSVNPLWQATFGGKTEGVLKAVMDRFGGQDAAPIISDPLDKALALTGLDKEITPEVRASLSADPQIRELSSVLRQTDSNASGRAYKQAEDAFRGKVANIQSEALGAAPGEVISKGDIDRYSTGKEIGNTLAKELDARIKPLSDGYEEFKNKFKSTELVPSLADKAEDLAKVEDKTFGQLQRSQRDLQRALKANNPEAAIAAQDAMQTAEDGLREVKAAKNAPGTTDQIAEKIMQRAQSEGWTQSPSSDIMKEVSRVLKELPLQKNLNDLTQFIKAVGDNTASKLPFGAQDPVSRAGGILKSIMRDAEGEVLSKTVGDKMGPEALAKYDELRKGYGQAAQLKDQVSSTLGLKGSTSGYAKALKAMASEDGEKILQRLSGKGDAAWLDLVQKQFPETAALLQKHAQRELLAAATKDGVLSSQKLMTALDKMSPQARAFAISPENLGKIKAANALKEALDSETHNYSNTARTLMSQLQGMAGSVVGLASAVASHSPVIGSIIGPLVKTLGKDIPDAARLSLLKFLGSNQPIEGGGFKAMTQFIHHTMEGENRIATATKNVFKATKAVLPASQMPSKADRNRLDKQLKAIQENPSKIYDVGNKTAHYMPEAGSAMAATAGTAVQYLNSIRPTAKALSPLDPKLPVTSMETAAYNRALDIAQQPLIVLEHIQHGTLLPSDMQHLNTMYPALLSKLRTQLTSNMMDSVNKEEMIPYNTRMGLSLFLGQPLDSTMTPSAIMAAQPKPSSPGPQQPGAPVQGAKHSMTALNKLPASYQTASQTRQAAREGRES